MSCSTFRGPGKTFLFHTCNCFGTILLCIGSLLGVAHRGLAEEPLRPKVLQAHAGQFASIAQTEDDQWDLAFDLKVAEGRPAPKSLRVLFAAQDAKNHYLLDITHAIAKIALVRSGEARKLASNPGDHMPKESPCTVLLRRRPSMLYVLVGSELVLDVMDTTFQQGAAAVDPAGGAWAISNVRYQPTEDIIFSDDFMRTAEEQSLGVWTRRAGEWQFRSVKETNVHADFKLSVNPFSLGGHVRERDWAMLTAGYPFWMDYEYSVSLKSTGGTAGLAFGYQSDTDFFAVRWEFSGPALRPCRIQLVKVTPQGREVLAQGYAVGATEQWYRLGVRTQSRRIQVFLDENRIFDLVDDRLRGGPVGLYAEGKSDTYFDDVSVRTHDVFQFDEGVMWWRNAQKVEGNWKVVPHEQAGQGRQTPFHLVTCEGSREAKYVFGVPSWTNKVLATNVKVESGSGWCGLLFRYADSRNYRLFRWSREGANGKLQLVRVEKGKQETYAEAPGGYSVGRWHRLGVDLSEEGRTKVYVDDNLALMAFEPRGSGRAGLYTEGALSCAFGRTEVRSSREQDTEELQTRPVFAQDPFMLLWSSPQGRWFPAEGAYNTYWNVSDFHGAYDAKFPYMNGMKVAFSATDTQFDKGYLLETRADKDGANRSVLALSKLGAVKATKVVDFNPLRPGTIAVRHDGSYFWIEKDSTPVLVYRDPAPLNGRRMGVTATSTLEPSRFEVTRRHVIDCLFEAAPTEWVQFGKWVVTNRFSCTPTWSHMTGMSDRAAALWSKYGLDGDFTIEYFAGARMQVGKAMSYPRIGDMNVTICGKDMDLGSGYSYLVGAWDPGWTGKLSMLLRGPETVAKTDRPTVPRVRSGQGGRTIPVPWISAGRDIHGAWYYIKLRRTGNRFEAFFDNVKVLDYEDPKPLDGQQFALWTLDNEIVLARVKVSYQHKVILSRLMGAEYHPESPPTPGDYRLLVESPTHPAVVNTFETGIEGWQPATADNSVSVDTVPIPSDSLALRVTNATVGGDFGVRVPTPAAFDLSRAAKLQFRYCFNLDARANLYVKVQDKEHFVHLNGPSQSDDLLPCLGEVEDFRADNQWHVAFVDIAAAARTLYPTQTALPLQELKFGCFHPGYLNAGIGGNRFGAQYALDDFQLTTAGSNAPQFQWSLQAASTKPVPTNVSHFAMANTEPSTIPGSEAAVRDGARSFENLKDGQWYLHVRAATQDGVTLQTAHVPFYVSQKAPKATEANAPRGDWSWGGEPIALALKPAEGLNLDLTRTTLSVNGQEVEKPLDCVDYDWMKRVLTLDLTPSGLTFKEGERVEARVTYATVLSEPETFSATRKMSYAQDKRPPERVEVANYQWRDDFEHSTGRWSGAASTIVARDSHDAAEGKSSLRVTNTTLAGAFGVNVTDQSFSVGANPLLLFHYKIPEEIHTDLCLTLGGETYDLTFTDTDNAYIQLGAIPDVQADEKWHHAQVNLQDLVARRRFRPNMYDVSAFSMADTGYVSGVPGACYHVDDVNVVPTASGSAGIKLALRATDVAGIQKYQYKWSAQASDTPDSDLPPEPEQTLKAPLEGLVYLHLRAQDRAGNWSAVAHYPFLVDNQAPTVGAVSPAQGSKMAASRIGLSFAGQQISGIDPQSLVVQFNGKSYPLQEHVTEYDPNGTTYVWHWPLATGFSDQPVANGTQLSFSLPMARDFAGNTAAGPSWRYTVDYASDKEPPLPPQVESSTATTLFLDTFLQGIGQWRNYGGRSGGEVARVFDAAKNDYCLRVLTRGSAYYGVWAYQNAIDLLNYPVLSFEYKIPAAVKLHLLITYAGTYRSVYVTGSSPYYTQIGQVQNVRQDERWHVASVNLLQLMKQAFPGNAQYTISGLIIGDYGSGGQYYYVDNVGFVGASNAQAQFRWTAVDPTGVQGYGYAMDTNGETVPDTQSKGAAKGATLGPLAPGLYYLHLRAQDGAGNWGGTTHYPYLAQ